MTSSATRSLLLLSGVLLLAPLVATSAAAADPECLTVSADQLGRDGSGSFTLGDSGLTLMRGGPRVWVDGDTSVVRLEVTEEDGHTRPVQGTTAEVYLAGYQGVTVCWAPVADPGTTDPETADPGVTDPGVTDPGVTDPGTTDPGTTDPGVTDPGIHPGATDVGASDRGNTVLPSASGTSIDPVASASSTSLPSSADATPIPAPASAGTTPTPGPSSAEATPAPRLRSDDRTLATTGVTTAPFTAAAGATLLLGSALLVLRGRLRRHH